MVIVVGAGRIGGRRCLDALEVPQQARMRLLEVNGRVLPSIFETPKSCAYLVDGVHTSLDPTSLYLAKFPFGRPRVVL